MKTSHKTKKASPRKQNRNHERNEAQKNFTHLEKVNTEMKNWGSTISNRIIKNYAIPFTRLIEAKLISLQSRV